MADGKCVCGGRAFVELSLRKVGDLRPSASVLLCAECLNEATGRGAIDVMRDLCARADGGGSITRAFAALVDE